MQGAATTCEEVPTKTAPTGTYCGDFFVCSICETRYSTSAVPLCHYVVRCLPRGWGSNDTEIPTCQLLNQKLDPIDGTTSPVCSGDQALRVSKIPFPLRPGPVVLHACLAGPCYNYVGKYPMLSPRSQAFLHGDGLPHPWTLVPRKSALHIPWASYCLGIIVGLSGVLVAGVWCVLHVDCAAQRLHLTHHFVGTHFIALLLRHIPP